MQGDLFERKRGMFGGRSRRLGRCELSDAPEIGTLRLRPPHPAAGAEGEAAGEALLLLRAAPASAADCAACAAPAPTADGGALSGALLLEWVGVAEWQAALRFRKTLPRARSRVVFAEDGAAAAAWLAAAAAALERRDAQLRAATAAATAAAEHAFEQRRMSIWARFAKRRAISIGPQNSTCRRTRRRAITIPMVSIRTGIM